MKNLALLAIAGGAIAITAPQAQAEPITPTAVTTGNLFDPTDASDTSTANGFHAEQGTTNGGAAWVDSADHRANQLTAYGTIEKYIKFKIVDSNLELGDLGDPTKVGTVYSAPIVNNNASGTTSVDLTNADGDKDGLAEVTFDANTYVQVRLVAEKHLVNVGPDAVSQVNAGNLSRPAGDTAAHGEFDNYVIPISYRVTAKGKYLKKITRTGGAAAADPHYIPASGSGEHQDFTHTAENTYEPFFASLEDTLFAEAGNPGTKSDGVITFEPNGGSVGTGTAAGSNGFQVGALIKRDGLNDYHGQYVANVNLTYWNW